MYLSVWWIVIGLWFGAYMYENLKITQMDIMGASRKSLFVFWMFESYTSTQMLVTNHWLPKSRWHHEKALSVSPWHLVPSPVPFFSMSAQYSPQYSPQHSPHTVVTASWRWICMNWTQSHSTLLCTFAQVAAPGKPQLVYFIIPLLYIYTFTIYTPLHIHTVRCCNTLLLYLCPGDCSWKADWHIWCLPSSYPC